MHVAALCPRLPLALSARRNEVTRRPGRTSRSWRTNCTASWVGIEHSCPPGAITIAVPTSLAGGQLTTSVSVDGALADPNFRDNSATIVTPIAALAPDPAPAPAPNPQPPPAPRQPVPDCPADALRLVELSLVLTLELDDRRG
jgi:hypothetical protein